MLRGKKYPQFGIWNPRIFSINPWIQNLTIYWQIAIPDSNIVFLIKAARKETGNNPIKKDQPPDSYLDYWKKENFPDGLALIDQMIGDFDAQIQCAGDVDQ